MEMNCPIYSILGDEYGVLAKYRQLLGQRLIDNDCSESAERWLIWALSEATAYGHPETSNMDQMLWDYNDGNEFRNDLKRQYASQIGDTLEQILICNKNAWPLEWYWDYSIISDAKILNILDRIKQNYLSRHG